MGKGARSRERNVETNKEKKIKELEAAAKNKKNKLVTAVISVVLVVCIVAGLCVNSFYYSNGQYLREKTAVTSETVEVDGAMLLYFYNSTLNSYTNYYGGYLDLYLGIDSTKSLRDQLNSSTGTSWFDSFMSETQAALDEVMSLYEKAQAEGFTLTAEQQEIVQNEKDKIDMSLFNDMLTKSDIEKCIDLSMTATFYKLHILSQYEFSDEEIQTIYDADPAVYQKVSYRYYDIDYSDTDDTLYKGPEANLKALELEAAESEEKFVEIQRGIIKDLFPDLSDEGIQNTIDNTVVENAGYTEGDFFSEWAFSDERQVGDTAIDDSNDGYYRVYYLLSLPEKQTYKTVNVRHILISTDDYSSEEAKEKADELLTQWKNGEATEQSFAKLASINSSDVGSVNTGGLYKNVTQGYMVEEFNDWIFDESRQAGDAEVVATTYGYHVMYYVGEGYEAWAAEIVSDLENDQYSADIDALKNKYPIEYNDEVIDKIPGAI